MLTNHYTVVKHNSNCVGIKSHIFLFRKLWDGAETGIVEEEIITHHHALGLFHDLYLPVMISTTGLIITQRVQGRMIRVPAATGTVDQIRGHSVQWRMVKVLGHQVQERMTAVSMVRRTKVLTGDHQVQGGMSGVYQDLLLVPVLTVLADDGVGPVFGNHAWSSSLGMRLLLVAG